MSDYTTTTDVKDIMPESGLNTSTDYDAMIPLYITAASRLIDRYLAVPDNYFSPSTDGETRYYNGNNDYELCIDDYVSIFALAVSLEGGVNSSDYTSYDSTDWYGEPYNASANGKPYNKIVIDVINSTKDPFPRYRKAVKVTGIFGYSLTIHPLVAQACKVQTLHFFMRAKSAYQNQSAGDNVVATNVAGGLSEDVKLLLMPLLIDRL